MNISYIFECLHMCLGFFGEQKLIYGRAVLLALWPCVDYRKTRSRKLYLIYIYSTCVQIDETFSFHNHNSLTQQVKITALYLIYNFFFASVAGFYDFTIDERTSKRTRFNADISSNWLDGIRSTISLSSLIQTLNGKRRAQCLYVDPVQMNTNSTSAQQKTKNNKTRADSLHWAHEDDI